MALHTQQQFLDALQSVLAQQRVQDLRALRGLLALDSGDVTAAEKHFWDALELSPRYEFESRPIAARYLELMKQSK